MSYPRSRSESSGWVYKTGHSSTVGINHSYSDDYSFSYNFEISSKSMQDTVTPDYSQKIANGEVVNYPMHFTRWHHEFGDGVSSFSYTTSGKEYRVTVESSPEREYGQGALMALPSAPASAADARRRALANVDSTPHAMLEDVFEIRQTLKFLRNPLLGLLELSKAFKLAVKRLQRIRKLTRAEALASVWLQYRFAVTPLVNSAYNVVDGLGSLGEPRPKNRRARGKSENSKTVSDTYTPNNSWSRKATRTESVSAGIGYTVSNPAAEWRYVFGLRSKDLPLAMWQVVPLSFMVDRVADISGTIAGLTNLLDPDISIKYAWVTTKTEDIYVNVLLDVPWRQDFSSSGKGYKYTNFIYDRISWTPSGIDTIPTINLSGLVSSVTKITDLVALIVQNFQR